MFNSISNSWQLVKASWAVLKADKELLLFPIISGITMVIITLVMLVPSAIVMFSLGAADMDEGAFNVVGFIGLFIFYLVTYTITYYFNTGLVGAALIRLDGGDPTVSDGFRIANQNIGKIIGYAAISATVGMVLRWIQERGILGQIAAGFIGLAWNVATFLVVPILVTRDVGPWQAVQESTNLLKRTWGEQITGNFGIGAVFGLIFFLVAVVGIGLIAAMVAATESVGAMVAGIVLLVLVFLTLGIIQGALTGIYQAAVFRYAEDGVVPDAYDIELIQGAFKLKNKRG